MLRGKGIDEIVLERFPYTISAISDFEDAMQVIGYEGIHEVMIKKTQGEERLWSLDGVLRKHFNAERMRHIKPLFRAEFDAIGAQLKSRANATRPR
jgi:hypothetical protein